MSALTDNAVPSEDVWKEEMRKCAEINAAVAAANPQKRPLISDLSAFSGSNETALYQFIDAELAAKRQPTFRCSGGLDAMRSLELRYRLHYNHERVGMTIIIVTAPRKTVLKK